MRLEGRAALVTGAAVRVGREIARALARRGAKVAIHYRGSRAQALALVHALERESGVEAAAFRADLESEPQVRALARAVEARFGPVRLLVHNASIYERTPFGRVRGRDIDRHCALHLRAPLLLSQALAPGMRRAGGGKIVHIADWAGLRPYRGYLPYCASKAAMLALSAGLAKELAPGIQVNALLPGPVLPPAGASAAYRRAAARANLLGRLGSPEDVARAVLFLADSDFITGAALPVDGGRLIA